MGGALVRHGDAENYRTYFYVLAAILAAAAIGCALCYDPPLREPQMSMTTAEKLRQLDWIGYALFTPGLTLFCMALVWSNNPYDWSNSHVFATFVASIVLIVGFFVYEWRFKTDGVLNHRLFKNRNFPLSMLLIFCEGLAFWATNNYFSFEVSVITGVDLLIAALNFAVGFAAAMAAAFAIGLVASRWQVVKIPMAVGFLLLLSFNIGMATMTPSTPHAAFWGIVCLAGLGARYHLTIVDSHCPDEHPARVDCHHYGTSDCSSLRWWLRGSGHQYRPFQQGAREQHSIQDRRGNNSAGTAVDVAETSHRRSVFGE